MYSSVSSEWETPQSVFDELNSEFNFTLDPCATDENHKCDKYYTKETNGLKQNWSGEVVFCNPPYGREIADWVEKCYEESQHPNTKVVMLIPCRPDTKWFHKYIYKQAEIRFFPKRFTFRNKLLEEKIKEKGKKLQPAPFSSMLVVF